MLTTIMLLPAECDVTCEFVSTKMCQNSPIENKNACVVFYGFIAMVGLGLLIAQVSGSHPVGHTTLGRSPLME